MTEVHSLFPLGTSQRDIWFDQILHADSPLYNLGGYAKINGVVDPERFELAVNLLVKKHDALRLVITEANDESGLAQQSFFPQLSVTVPLIDFSEQPDAQAQALAWMQQCVVDPFVLYEQPLFRYTQLKISPNEFYFVGVYHHLITDGWSIALLTRSLADIYTSLSHGDEPDLSAFSYLDYLEKENDYIHSLQYQKDRDYWQQEYKTTPPALLSPSYRSQTTGDITSGKCHTFYLQRAIYNQLNVLANELKVSSFHLILGVLYTYFIRTSQQSNLIIGLPILNRSNANFRKTAGLFVGISPLNFDFGADLSFTSLVENISKTLKRTYRHQRFPISEINQLAGLTARGERSQLFDLSVSYEKQSHDSNFGDCSARSIGLSNQMEQTPLTVFIRELNEAEDVQVDFSYNLAYFNQQDIEGIAARFNHILEYILIEPNKLVADIPLLPSAEVQQLKAWNDTQAEYPADKCIHELFEIQAKENPDAIALVFEDQQLTYRELNQQANQLAHYLVNEKNIKPDTLIGICLDRSLEMVIAILGILKGGGAYVPLDPDYPQARLTYMLEDAGLDTVLTTTDVLARTPTTSVQALCLDDVQTKQKLSLQPKENVVPDKLNLTSSHLAYVIYTSGSTGQPKGVMVEHHSLVNLTVAEIKDFDIHKNDRVLHLISFNFDPGTGVLFSAINAGATLYFSSVRENITEFMKKYNITHASFPSALLMAQTKPNVSLPELRVIATGGEACSIDVINAWAKDRTYFNLYGPTESTITAVRNECKNSVRNTFIGKPLDNVKCYVLSECRKVLPIGAEGELYIGGEGVSRGYLNKPDLTADKFILNPFSDDSDDLLYKTDDMVRWSSNGKLEYLGRIDDQVKIRGFRIELGEIENTLLTHDSIKEAVVVAREEESGDKRLVAYLVPNTNTNTNTADTNDDWHDYLSQILPEYMVPSAFVVLDRLPLTPNGKVDKKALPAPDMSQQQDVYVAPTTATEKILCDIWQDILGLEQVGITDNFFRLGGHSLLLIQLLSRLQEAGLNTDVKSLFSVDSLGALATLLDSTIEAEHLVFKAPANLILSDCEQLTPQMLPLINLSQAEIDHISAVVPGGIANIQDIYPLAPLQEGILFHHQISVENKVADPYVSPALLSTKTIEQRDEFLRALQSVINRHDVLRTAILWTNLPQAVQVVYRDTKLPIEVLEFNPRDDFNAQLMAQLSPDQESMDLSQAPLLRVQIVDDPDASKYYILLKLHHLITDHVGLEIIQTEVDTILQGKVSLLEKPAPYREFVAHVLHQTESSNAETFFKETFGHVTEPTIPFNLMDVHGDGSNIIEATQMLPEDLSQQIRVLSRRLNVSPAALFHLGFGLVLSACSGRDDVVFGTVLSGRLQGTTSASQMLGMFINTLPCRLSLKDQSVEAMVLQAQAELIALLPYEQTSLALVQQCSGLASGTPLFSAMLNYRHSAPAKTNSSFDSGLQVEEAIERSNYPFTVLVDDLGEGFSLTAQVDASLVPERIIGYLQTAMTGLFDALTNLPEKPVLDISILSEPERHQQLIEWNDTATDFPKDKCIHELFEAQVKENPDAIAVIFEESQLTYQELNQKANQLAHYLIEEREVTPDTLVGICLERSLEMIVGIMGVLKAGGAYVPLDPSYPEARLVYMLEDANLTTVLTQISLEGETPVRDSQAICLDSDEMLTQLKKYQDNNPVVERLSSSHLAYVIYTSGSTGNPKGVMVEHKALHNRIDWMDSEYGCTSGDKILQKTPCSFDVSVWEFFWPLSVGAQLVFAIPDGHKDPVYLAQLIQSKDITKLHFVPSMLSNMLASGALSECSSLKQVFCSGEALSPLHVQEFFAMLPMAELHNLYGPTEAAIDVSYWSCPTDILSAVPIGRAINNIQLHVLNNMMMTPLGAVGELHIGGVGLARGYLNQLELTAERFIPNPFFDKTNPNSSERLYKTGDLVRYLPDGNLEYLGRIDHQVKIRGFRIELGEIEQQLLSHTEINDAVVVALSNDDDQGDKRLVAYVTHDEATTMLDEGDNSQVLRTTLIDSLRQQLSQELPGHMVPSAFVVLESLPLTPNGKVDRKSLPAPDMSLQQKVYVAPTTETEKLLCEIWREVLGLEQVGITDNFFELGGHSLSVIKLVVQMNQGLNANVMVKDVFSAPSISQLLLLADFEQTAVVYQQLNDGLTQIATLQQDILSDPQCNAALPENYDDFYPLSKIQQSMVFFAQTKPDVPIYHDQFPFVLSWPDFNIEIFTKAIELLSQSNPILRSSFDVVNFDFPIQVVHSQLAIELPLEDLSHLPAAEQQAKIQLYCDNDLKNKFQFQDNQPLWRVQLFTLGNDQLSYVLSFQHAILDGWSVNAMMAELTIIYSTLISRPEQRSKLTPLKKKLSSYKDYIAIDMARSTQADTSVFWQKYLQDYSRMKLPYNYTGRVISEEKDGRVLCAPVGREILQQLQARAQREGFTIKEICLAAHVYLLSLLTGDEEILTGVVSHDRPELPDSAEILGCFLNTLPLRLPARTSCDSLMLLTEVKSYLRQVKDHELFLGDIARTVGEYAPTGNPLFDTLFNFTDFPLKDFVENSVAQVDETTDITISGAEMTNTLFDLEVHKRGDDGLVIQLKYIPQYFHKQEMESALDLYSQILQAFAGNEPRLEAKQFIYKDALTLDTQNFNQTNLHYAYDKPLDKLFEQQVKLTPDAVALRYKGDTLSYNSLNRKANQIARLLIRHGVKPNQRVGLIMDRSFDLIASMYGILKAGAAYVPMEPHYPLARKEAIEKSAGLTAILVDEYAVESNCLYIKLDEVCLQDLDDDNVDIYNNPQSLAYIIYTSGSTGTPKGVRIKHHSAVNLISWVNREFSIGSTDVMLFITSVCFDLSVYDVFGLLSAGGSIVIAEQTDAGDPKRLFELMKKEQVTFWDSVPTTINHLVSELDSESDVLTSLRLVFMSGDWIPVQLPAQIKSCFPEAKVISLGGATEGTVWSNYYPIVINEEERHSIPYGKPIDNNRFYILDRQQKPVINGVAGELYIAGVGVADGYQQDEEKTTAAFFNDPFVAQDINGLNARMYKTGDLGRLMACGNMEILGRIDHQVKIRGFRVELGEIESVICQHDQVKEVVVTLIGGTDTEGTIASPYLVAYVVWHDNTMSTETLIHYLQKYLPEYMVPSAFMVLDHLPLNTNGKVDRKKLPLPDMSLQQKEYVAPSTEIESAIAEIWQEVLDLEQVGVHDNFFTLGGHSLLVVGMLSRLESIVKISVPVRSVFEYPTLIGLAAHVDSLANQGFSSLPDINPRSAGQVVPLSLIQQSYWFLYQLENRGSTYNTPMVTRLPASLNVAVLEKSLQSLIARHENLRTRLVSDESGSYQIIDAIADWQLTLVEATKDELSNLVQQEVQQAFYLENEAAFRVKLFSLNNQDYVLSIVSHHTLMDGWSMDILFNELTQLYTAFSAGQSNPLAPLPIQYGDYALWQQEHIKGERYDTQCAYWQEKLQGLAPLLNLPTDHVRPSVQSYRGDACAVSIPLALSEQLSAYAQTQGVTLYHVLLGGLTVLLSRYARTTDIPIGTAIANRPQQVLEKLIGCFANTVVLRCDVQSEHSFNTIVKNARDTALDAFAHSDVPFDGVVEAVKPERSLGVPPIFQVMFRLHNQAQGEGVELQGLELIPFSDIATTTVELDLNISLSETPDGIQGEFAYATDLFDKTTIERFISHYCKVLSEAIKMPSAPVANLALLSVQEQQQLAVWNDTQVEYPYDEGIHELFETSAKRLPAKLAYVCGDTQYSYQVLNEQVNQLAHWLRSQGVGPEVRVAVCVGRTQWMGISLLAILKAGGTYVPLDPAYPKARLAHMVEEAKPNFILTEQDVIAHIPETTVRTICCDVENHLWAEEPTDNPAPITGGEHSAYILFTSGTTGKPKGILVSHQSLRNMAVAHQQWQLLDEDARILQFASLSFSISIWGSFMAWASGATLYQVTDDESLPGKSLYRLLNNAKISTVTWPVSLLSTLPMSDIPKSLTTIISSAEPCTDAVVARWVEHGCRFLNMYGNSEVAIGSTMYEYHNSEQKLSIGRALPNTQMYLLDEQLQPVPVGVVAEIYTAGVGLAKEYVNNKAETEKQFIANPFKTETGSRLYKTGDLGRYLPSGEIEFIGREDFQVSIRGFRIELTEVESVLGGHDEIAEVAVVARKDNHGSGQLVCYYVHKDGCLSVSTDELRSRVAKQLPNYMVPSLFISLDEMPLMANRKVDRLALPTPDMYVIAEEDYVAPTTKTEKALSEIWQHILGLEQVGVTDDFFHLGGHSLLAVRVSAQLGRALNVTLSVRSVFDYPLLGDLAVHVDGLLQQGVKSLPRINPREQAQAVPLSLIQQSYWFLYQLENRGSIYNTPLVLRLQGELNVSALEQCFQVLIARHDILRTRIVQNNSEVHQVIDEIEPWQLSVEVIDKNQLSVRVQQDVTRPFDLENEAAFRAILFQESEQEHVLSLVFHHIIMDGWSLDVIFKDLAQLYDAFCQGHNNPLAPLPIQYGDYAVWQQEHIKGERYDAQCAYWKKQLNGLAPLLNLPTDHVRPPVQSYRGASCPVVIPLPLTEQLSAYSQAQGVTLHHVLISALAILLSRYSRCNDIPIGTAIANRPQSELESLVGNFANGVVLRCDVQGKQSFDNLVSQTKNTMLDALEHADVPFDAVVEAVNPERCLGVPPIYQVLLRLHNQARGEGLSLQGLTLKPFVGSAKSTVELDLNISLAETAEGIQGEFAYATDLFREETITRFIEHYIELLTSVMVDSTQAIDSLGMLLPAEHQQLQQWNDTAVEYPKQQCVHTLFEATAVRVPNKLAYVCGEAQYDYQALNDKANQIAHWLRSQGVGPEVRVGVCVGRSQWMGLSLLAILKSGGTYVPLDPAYPKDRVAHMLAIADPVLILTEQNLLEGLPSSNVNCVCLDNDSELWDDGSTENPAHLPDSQHTAYVLFTSGTTGKPKGIQISHQSLRNVAVVQSERQLLDENHRILQFASLSFAPTIWSSVMAWAGGATLYQVIDSEASAGEPLYKLMNTAKITTATWPVSLLSVLPVERMPSSLKTIVSCAEPCTDAVVSRWVEHGCRFLNVYGNTEVAIGSTMYEYRNKGQKLTIGSPFPNTQVFLLDEQLQSVPVGVIAEIHTAGAGLAQGYVDQVEETAARFIANPFATGNNDRLYKTGDLGRYLSNGEIEFIGREDFQINIRGFRIELSEIEAVVRVHEALLDVVVVARPDNHGVDQLVCFYVIKPDVVLTSESELRALVAQKLPNYMVPAIFVALDEMPLTPNRKVDRLALPTPDMNIITQNEYVAPTTETEKALCEIWQDLLGLEKVSVTDNFFHLGGHSLLALRLVNKISNHFERHIEVTALFNAQTIRELSLVISTYQENETPGSCLRLMRSGDESQLPVYIVPGVGGSLLNMFELSNALSTLGNVYGLQAVGLDDGLDPLSSVEEIARVNIEAMFAIQPTGHYRLVGHSFGGWIVFEMASQLKQLGKEVSIVLLDSPVPSQEVNQQRQALAKNKDQIGEIIDSMLTLSNDSGDSNYIAPEENNLTVRIKHIAMLQSTMFYQPKSVLNGVDMLFIKALKQGELSTDFSADWSSVIAEPVLFKGVESDHFGMLAGIHASTLRTLIFKHFNTSHKGEDESVAALVGDF